MYFTTYIMVFAYNLLCGNRDRPCRAPSRLTSSTLPPSFIFQSQIFVHGFMWSFFALIYNIGGYISRYLLVKLISELKPSHLSCNFCMFFINSTEHFIAFLLFKNVKFMYYEPSVCFASCHIIVRNREYICQCWPRLSA